MLKRLSLDKVIEHGLYIHKEYETQLRAVRKYNKYNSSTSINGAYIPMVDVVAEKVDASHCWTVGKSYPIFEKTLTNNYDFVLEEGSTWGSLFAKVIMLEDKDPFEAIVIEAKENHNHYRVGSKVTINPGLLIEAWKLEERKSMEIGTNDIFEYREDPGQEWPCDTFVRIGEINKIGIATIEVLSDPRRSFSGNGSFNSWISRFESPTFWRKVTEVTMEDLGTRQI